ncbi:PREDICTED: leucine-rich repeat and IQ domain-containing protein 1 [Tinamus guttatus]|uniref:leucine-rich repeat and IQ domain-containing protein 1 n=1 Tax=Tinamus guttatus TaxID=94827 RepID=UPI00052E790A|nr:PREDICTED: leucine-rich repeat and IQ domain-containing protein 1 [Tinamus guttatus]
MENRMSEDVERIEKEIEIELSRISVSPFEADDPDTDLSEEALSDSDTISDDLPESILSYLNFIKNRNQDAEKLILQDLEDEEITSNVYEVVCSHASDDLAELALEYNEDPEELKKRVLSETESEDLQIAMNCNTESTTDDPIEMVTDEHFVAADVGMSISFTYLEVEEKCRQDFEQWEKRQRELEVEKREKWKAEKAVQDKENEEEQERRLHRLEEFEAEIIKLEHLQKEQQSMMEDELQKEKKAWREKMMQHEELMMKLQLQVEEEEKAFEEQKAKQRQHMAEQENAAAVKIQARFRSFLVHKKYAPILKEWKDKIKQEKEKQKEIQTKMKEKEERMKSHMEEMKQKKEEKKRQEERERQRYMEQWRRCEEYEKKKVILRLEREKQLQIRKEEQRKIKEKGTIMNENREKPEGNITEEQLGENLKQVREQKMEPSKQVQVVEEVKNQTVKMDETSNWMIPAKSKLTPPIPNTLNSEKEEPSSEVNNKNPDRNSGMTTERSSSDSGYLNTAPVTSTSNKESVDFRAGIIVENEDEVNTNSRPLNVQTPTNNREIKDHFFQSEIAKTTVFLVKDSHEKHIENWDKIQDVAKYFNTLEILPDDVEKKRLNWMKTCKPWCKIFGENQRKTITKKKHSRKISVNKMPPLSAEKIIHSGPWSTLQQVTILTLEDLPECSLSTLSECANLQVLTVRRCGLVALEGLSNCKDLKYINVEENNIQIIDCENLENLCILILSKNRLSSVCGLDGCRNLRNLELSYNKITRIGGLESLKNLQQLIMDHNQLISTKGLCEAPTLMHLDCSFNHLTQVEGIENSGLLQILKLQGNNLQELPRLENHVLLRELYLDDNSISSMRTFSLFWLPLLQILSLSQNSLTELAPLKSYVSLEKLDIRNNCLSDLKSVMVCLNGCHKLSELSLTGNPILQERTWRSSLCKVLNNLQFLNGENINYHTLLKTEGIKESESRTFLELCQSQIEENVLLKKTAASLGIASSIDDAQKQCQYFNQLMKLSFEHRRAHEYGELNRSDRDVPEALHNHLKQTSTGCLQENNLFIMGATENKQVLLDPSERWIATHNIQATFINSSIPEHRQENKEHHRVKQESTESCISYDGETNGKDNTNKSAQLMLQQSVSGSNAGRNLQHFDINTKKLHMSASVIQSIWRKYHAKKAGCTKTENDQFTDASGKKHEAATLIQAFWKGFLLRKKLASALAAVKSDEVEDDYEEITVDDYTFHEATLEKEWLVLDTTRFPSKTVVLSNQLHWPKKSMPSEASEHPICLPLAPLEAWQCDDRPHSCSPETNHFRNISEKGAMSQLSDMKEKKKFLFRSEKEEKISEEWGFKDISTAQLMLKRAHKMKPKKFSNKKLDPAVRLALFKNNENKHLPVKPPRKTQPVNTGYFEGKREEFSQLDTALDEKLLQRKDFTYQWLHTQVWDYEAASSRNTKCNRFLPELDPAICNGRRVQLVASPVSREDTDLDLVSMTSGSALTQNREKNNQPHRHSARSAKKSVSTPERSHLGPSHKEQISFRDHPVQLSGGWGSGKKRQKLKNIS